MDMYSIPFLLCTYTVNDAMADHGQPSLGIQQVMVYLPRAQVVPSMQSSLENTFRSLFRGNAWYLGALGAFYLNTSRIIDIAYELP